jgi:hypothetical protein
MPVCEIEYSNSVLAKMSIHQQRRSLAAAMLVHDIDSILESSFLGGL